MEQKTTMHPRKLARSMARSRLDASKVTGYNKERVGVNGKKQPSVFARNWRELAQKAAGLVKPRKGRA